jgi:hypothetical protein
MKKIILMVFGTLSVLIGFSQSNGNASNAKTMSIEEANKLNGVAQPKMADGRTYSQYKAEVQAKQAAEKQNQAKVATPVGLTPTTAVATAPVENVASPTVNTKGTSAEVTTPAKKTSID